LLILVLQSVPSSTITFTNVEKNNSKKYFLLYLHYTYSNIKCSLTRRVNKYPKIWEDKCDTLTLIKTEKERKKGKDKKEKRTDQTETDTGQDILIMRNCRKRKLNKNI
jgi:hypothetical protein